MNFILTISENICWCYNFSMAGNWDELIQQIKERLDIVEVVSEQVVLKKRGNNYWGLCPFHKDKTPSFSIVDKGNGAFYW